MCCRTYTQKGAGSVPIIQSPCSRTNVGHDPQYLQWGAMRLSSLSWQKLGAAIWLVEFLKSQLVFVVLVVPPLLVVFPYVFLNSTKGWLHLRINMIKSSVPSVLSDATFNHSWSGF